ncbi:MAG: hypothetical protein IPK29_07860 [Betaproteobacteria bacterium]|nr:hypothetical protein [Betaproteobacteria bacterium]
MSETDDTPEGLAHEYVRFDNQADFQAAVDRLLAQSGRELRIFDTDLSVYKFNSPQRVQALRDFLAASRSRRVQLVVHDTDYITKHCPRLMDLLAQYAHAMQINRTHEEIRELADSFAVLDKHHYVRRPVARHFRGAAGFNDETQALIMRSRFAEIWAASFPGVSANTLGL